MTGIRLLKVVAYVTRVKNGRAQLLVFVHRDFPEAGVQVPAGSVNDGEALEKALFRELDEETGRSDFRLNRKLGVLEFVHPETGNTHERHVYHLRASDEAPEAWEWLETGGGELADEDGYLFQYYWADFGGGIALAGHLGDLLNRLEGEG
jgi:8-oxo-dGTP diphosphatase